ncbi:hypothetical protein [Xanthomonas citri]|uniref:hypothetical protein n=1 Tax=Xanthomonas citri TaxID=346 RepID=UPI0012FE9BA5|nr:hypothetical protein [Xanthomonas citri]
MSTAIDYAALPLRSLARLRIDQRHAARQFDTETTRHQIGDQIPFFDRADRVALVRAIAFDFDLDAHRFGFERGALAVNGFRQALRRGDGAGFDGAINGDLRCVAHGLRSLGWLGLRRLGYCEIRAVLWGQAKAPLPPPCGGVGEA